MRSLTLALAIGVLALAGCGSDSEPKEAAQTNPPPSTEETAPATEHSAPDDKLTGTEIVLDDSEFGSMLFDSKDQAIYIFENDSKDKSTCYEECAVAWPPVFTEGEPKAGKGVKQSLLGTIKRRDGKQQVTYAGKPLYFYAHAGPGEVRCHNVHLNGGLWWVVGADGKRRP